MFFCVGGGGGGGVGGGTADCVSGRLTSWGDIGFVMLNPSSTSGIPT